MSNDNTAKPTGGVWEVVPGDDYQVHSDAMPEKYPHAFPEDSTGSFVAYVGNHAADFGEANANLIAEAGNVFNETGLTPRQLVEQRDECLTLLRAVLKTVDNSDFWWMDCPDHGGFDADAIRAIIAKVEAKP